MNKISRLEFLFLLLYALSVISGIVILLRRPPTVKTEFTPLRLRKMTTSNAIAVVEIYGPVRITQRKSLRAANSDRIVRRLRSLSHRSDVKAVLLRINSPGGSVAAIQEIYNEVINLRKSGKVVVASLADIAASGGYYIASAADKIVANPGTLTGSVGVIFELVQAQELMKKIGVKIETIKSGKHKDIGSITRELTPEERQILQTLINNAYEQFVNAIATGRNIPKEKVLEFADGRIFTGEQAKTLGIVDEIGSRIDAINLAAKLAGIEGTPHIITERDPFEEFIATISEMTDSVLFEDIMGQKVRFEYIFE